MAMLLEKMQIIHKEKVLYDISFVPNLNFSPNKLLTTLIIGKNGSGKSYLLNLITNCFKDIEEEIAHQKTSSKISLYKPLIKYDNVKIQYTLEGNKYSVSRTSGKYEATINDNDANIVEVRIPKRILAVSFMVDDKFRFSFSTEESYRYLGIRQTSNAAYTSSIGKRICESFFKKNQDDGYVNRVMNILEFMDYDRALQIRYKLIKPLVHGKIDITFVRDRITKWNNRKSFLNYKYTNVTDNLLDKMIQDWNYFLTRVELAGSEALVTINDSKSTYSLSEFEDVLELFTDLEIVKLPTLELFRNEAISFDYASSGEKHFIYTMINLAIEIKHNSLILIDEPELSLHPNWQTKYVNQLKDIFAGYKSSHVILASHSHFIVSDLEPKSSSIVSIQRNSDTDINAARICTLLEENTYGWSAEDILLNVFNMPGSRNFYLSNLVGELLTLISAPDRNVLEIKNRVKLLKTIQTDLKEIDPLKMVIDKIIERVDGIDYTV